MANSEHVPVKAADAQLAADLENPLTSATMPASGIEPILNYTAVAANASQFAAKYRADKGIPNDAVYKFCDYVPTLAAAA